MTHSLDHVDDAWHHGLELLEQPDGSSIGAVMCLSSHLAAFCAVIEPALLRHGSTRTDLRGLHELSAELGRTLRLLERASSGEAAASGVDRARLAAEAAELTRQAGAAEMHLLERLSAALSEQEAQELVERYERMLQHGPTRPHTANPHNRALRRVNAWRDHVMDVMDARYAPIQPPAKEHVVTGRERRGQTQARHPA